MTGWKKKFSDFFNHERYQIITICLAVCLIGWIYGCPSRTPSILDPFKKVTRGELKAEVDYYLAMAENRYADLDRQDELKQMLVKHAILVAETGTFNPMGIIAAVLAAVGIGATVDNIRKRAEIKKIKGTG